MTQRDDLAGDIASFPRQFHESGLSPVAVLATIFQRRRIENLSLLDSIKDVFRSDPVLLHTWQVWAEDKRESTGWVIAQREHNFRIWRLDDKDGVADLAFSNREYAFAVYALLEVEWLSRYLIDP